MDIEKYITESKTMEKATFVGPYADGQELLKWLHDHGWHGLRVGPYTDAVLHPRFDMSRFLFVMEREISL